MYLKKQHKNPSNIRKPKQENPTQIKTYNWDSPVCVNVLFAFSLDIFPQVKQLYVKKNQPNPNQKSYLSTKKIVWLVILIDGYLYQRPKIVFLIVLDL